MRLSLCMVGCGRYARKVLEHIQDMAEELELYFASRDLNKAKEYCESFGGGRLFRQLRRGCQRPQRGLGIFSHPSQSSS